MYNNIYQILNRDNILNASTLLIVISGNKDIVFLLNNNAFGG
jgi:hypothetical protein